MADILNVSFKIDTGNLEGDAAAAGKLAAKAFEQGFGALDLKAVGQRISAGLGSGKAAEPAVKANDAAAEKHAAVRHGGDGGDGGEGERGGEGEGSPLHKGIEGLTAAMEGLTKLVEGGSLLAAAPALLSGLKGLGGSALDAGEGLTGISLLRRLAGRFGVGRASEDELEGVGTMFGGEQSAMAGAAGRMAALRRGEEKEVINQRLHDLGLGGVRPAVAAAGETGAAEGIAGAAAAAGGGLLGSLPGGGIGTAIGGAVGGPPGAVVGGVLGKLIGGAAGAFAITKLTEGAVKGAEAIKDVGLEAAHTDERLHNMAEIIGTSFEKFMRVREVAAKGGVDLDDWARGFTRLAIQIRKELPEVERQYEDSGNVMTESNIKVKDSERGITEARLAREAATDQTKKAEAALAIEQELGPETREEQREAAALGVSGAAVGMEGAQFGLARAQLKLAFAPQEQAFGDITGPNAIANADVSIGGAVIRARQADIADREAHGERVSGAEKRQLRMDAADQALWAANQGVTNAQVAFRGAVLQNQERKAANDAGLGPEGQAALGYDQAVQAVKQAALAQKQAETQQKMVETMTRLADRMAGPEAQRAVEGAQTQEGKAADNQTQAAIAENRAKKDQRLFALYGDKPTVTQALQGKPPEMRPGEGDYDYSQIGPADLHAALLHRGAQMGGGAFGAINAMGEAIQKVSDLRPEEGTQFGLSAVSSLFPSLRGFRGNEGPEALKHLVDLVNSPAARGPGGLAGALSPEDMEELQPYIDLNTKKLPEARGLIEKERGAFSTGEQQTQKTGLEAIPAAGAVVQTGEVGAKVGGGVAQAALGALNTAVSGIGNAFSGAAGIIGSGASSVGGALGALASKLSGWSPPAAGSGGKGGGGGGGHEADVLEQAGGGLISGPGSGTSDSIPAWLSHGEYIVKADSVQKLGVTFLDRLNAGQFAFGGLVRGFAEGGAVDAPETDDFTHDLVIRHKRDDVKRTTIGGQTEAPKAHAKDTGSRPKAAPQHHHAPQVVVHHATPVPQAAPASDSPAEIVRKAVAAAYAKQATDDQASESQQVSGMMPSASVEMPADAPVPQAKASPVTGEAGQGAGRGSKGEGTSESKGEGIQTGAGHGGGGAGEGGLGAGGGFGGGSGSGGGGPGGDGPGVTYKEEIITVETIGGRLIKAYKVHHVKYIDGVEQLSDNPALLIADNSKNTAPLWEHGGIQEAITAEDARELSGRVKMRGAMARLPDGSEVAFGDDKKLHGDARGINYYDPRTNVVVGHVPWESPDSDANGPGDRMAEGPDGAIHYTEGAPKLTLAGPDLHQVVGETGGGVGRGIQSVRPEGWDKPVAAQGVPWRRIPDDVWKRLTGGARPKVDEPAGVPEVNPFSEAAPSHTRLAGALNLPSISSANVGAPKHGPSPVDALKAAMPWVKPSIFDPSSVWAGTLADKARLARADNLTTGDVRMRPRFSGALTEGASWTPQIGRTPPREPGSEWDAQPITNASKAVLAQAMLSKTFGGLDQLEDEYPPDKYRPQVVGPSDGQAPLDRALAPLDRTAAIRAETNAALAKWPVGHGFGAFPPSAPTSAPPASVPAPSSPPDDGMTTVETYGHGIRRGPDKYRVPREGAAAPSTRGDMADITTYGRSRFGNTFKVPHDSRFDDDGNDGSFKVDDENLGKKQIRVPGALAHHDGVQQMSRQGRPPREDIEGMSPRSAERRHIAHVKSGWDPIYSPMPGASRHHYDDGFALGGLVPGFASGGLARVSNGEYRIGAGAVTKYGAGVMAMLNQGRFDSGGLVGGSDATNPGRFDDWGNGISRGLSASLPPGVSTQDHGSSSQHTLDLVTSAGQFRMQASQDTIEAIRSSAIGQKLTSAGTKPSWY